MKKFLFFIAVILIINQNIFSQNEEKKFTIQTNPFLWFIDIFADNENDTLFAMDLEGQIKINNSINLSLTLSFLIDNHIVEDYSEYSNISTSYKENVSQINLKPMFIYRPFSTGLRGFYLGFYPNIGVLHVESDEKNQLYTEFGFGINWGYKWVLRNGFTMQIGNGIGKTFSFPEGSRQHITINSDGRMSLMTQTDIQLLEFKMGYSF